MKRYLLRITTAVLAMLCIGTALAQQYPVRPIRLLVPILPGGAPDIAARVIGQKLADALGQSVVVDNRTGSNGNIAAEATVKAAPDGHTLMLCADSQLVINPHLYTKMTFDPLKDLSVIATVGYNVFVLSVNPALPAKTFQEFVDFARKASPPLHYASAGNGSQHQLTMEMLKSRAGIDLVHVPYKGGAAATTAAVAGEVAAMFAGTSTAPQIKAGRLRALATSGLKRSPAFPELPAIAEFYPGFNNAIWLALCAPHGTPAGILARLRTEVNKALAQPDVKEKLNNAGGLEPYVTTPDEMAALIRSENAKYAKVVKDIGATAE